MARLIDCIVVGAGPAGLVAALYLQRFRRSVVVARSGPSRAATIPRSHNYPGFPNGIGGPELLDRLHQQVLRHGDPAWADEATGLTTDGEIWQVTFRDQVLRARTVVLATGVRDRWPRMTNAEQAIREGVLRFCPVCDGFEAAHKRVAVIGSGDHAAREALFLRTYSADVTILTDGLSFSQPTAERLRGADVAFVKVRRGSLSFMQGGVQALNVRGEELPPFEVAYGALGVDPQTQLLRSLGIRLEGGGCVAVDEHQQTSLPGLYAAGDVVRGLDQISVAVGEAAIAATAIHNRIREEHDGCAPLREA